MQDQTKRVPEEHERRLERALVSQILRRDHSDGWLFAELAAELGDTDSLTIRGVLADLEEMGAVETVGERVRASRATRRLDELDMIAL
jgi:hypothetical protein